MADNAAQALKDLDASLQKADKNLISMTQTLYGFFNQIRQAGGDVKAIFDYISQKAGATKAEKIKILAEFVDDNGNRLTPKSIKDKIKQVSDTGKPMKLNNFIEINTKNLREMENYLRLYKQLYNMTPAQWQNTVMTPIDKALGGGSKSQASKEWKDQTKLSNEAKKAAEEAQDGYIKQAQASQKLTRTLEELRAKRAELESLPVTGIGKAGESFKSETTKANALKKVDAEIVKTEKDLNAATVAAQGFEAKLIAIGQGKRVSNMKKALGIDVVEPEMQKIPTVFDRVIEQINQRAAQNKDKLTKQLVDANGIKNEAENAFKSLRLQMPPLTRKSWQDLINIQNGPLGMSTLFAQNAMSQKMGWDVKSIEAMRSYQDALQSIINLQDKLTQSQRSYNANVSAVEGVTRRFNENEQAIARVRDRWEELNVKKQAGLVSQKDFDTQTQKILDEYDRLIAKRKEFEIGDLGQLSSQRKQFQERYKELLKEKDAAERARIARGLASTDPNMNAAVNKQVQYQRQLIALRKEYNALNNKQNRTQEENAILEQTKNKIKEIIGLARQLNKEQQGSHGLAKQITDYDRIKQKIHDANKATKEHKASLESILPTVQRLASAFGIAFSVQGLVQFGKKLVETRGEFELQQTALRSILQNKQLADEIWDNTMQAALQSPFTAMQLTTYTKQLAAYRIETEKLFDTTKMLADVSAGLGVDMQRLILAYGQVKSANFLRASEIRQFTEAGVNVLGELAEYFSETRDGIYSTAQVMDMVQKRLVKFEDIEAIFKRLTSEGGIFYDMQYVQSQTVKGQIAKLHDAYDQMLNSIGEANQGTIRNFVGLLNNIVKNWREWKTVLDSIAIPVLILSLKRFTQGFFAANSSIIATDNSFKLLTRSGAKLNVKLKEIYATLKANPWMAFLAVIGTATIGMWNHFKAVKAINDKYDELMFRSYETQKSMNGYIETIEKNVEIMKEAEKGTEEYNAANNENDGIITKLKNDYPGLLEGMDLQNIKYDQLIERIKLYNEELEDNIRLEYMAKAGIAKDDLQTNILEIQEHYRKREMEFLENRNRAEREYIKLKAQGRESEENYWEKQIRLAKNYEEQIKIITNPSALVNGFSLQISGYKVPGSVIGKSLEQRELDLRENNQKEALIINDIIRKQLQTINDDLGDDIYEFISKNKDKVDELFKYQEGAGWKLLNDRIVKFYTSKGADDNETRALIEKQLNKMLLVPIKLDWTKQVSSSTGNFSLEGSGSGNNSQNYKSISSLISILKEMNSEYDKLSKSAYGFAKSNEKVRDSFKDAFNEIFKFAGIDINQVDTTSKASTANAMQLVLEKLDSKKLWGKFGKDGGKKARQEFLKAFGQMKAEVDIQIAEQSRADFGRQMEEMFADYDLTLELNKLKLPSDVLSNLFDIESVDLSDLRKTVAEFYNERLSVEADSTELVKQVEQYYKKIDDLEKKQQRERIKEYAKYLEYELSERAKIEMEYARKVAEVSANSAFTKEEKEQIGRRLKEERDKSLAKQEWEDFKESETYIQMMEDLEHQGDDALRVMREELERIRENAENLSPRALKEVVNALEKIDEITIKRGMPITNIRNASSSLKKARVAALESGLSYSQVASRSAAKETQAEIKKTLLPLEHQYNILQSQLGAEKEIARLEEERYNNSLRLYDAFGEYFLTGDNEYLNELISNNISNIEGSQSRIAELQEQRKTASEKESQEISNKLAQEESNLACLQSENELLAKQLELNIAIANAQLDRAKPEERAQLQAQIDALEEELELLREQDKSVGNLTKRYKILGDSIEDAVKKIAEWGQTAVSVFESLKGMVDSFGVDTNTDGWDNATAAFETLGTLSSTASSMATDIASGNYIKAALDGIKGIFDIITIWNKNHDAKFERQIQEQQEKIDSLTKAYDRLGKEIERTFTTVSYMQDYNEMLKNIQQQIVAIENQRAAEEAKKNTDEDRINDFNEQIEESKDKLEELHQEQLQLFGGIGSDSYRSAAEEFVNAWKEAFLETGDGLQGLQDHFDEFLQDWFVNQATMRIAGSMLEDTFNMIDNAVEQNSAGGVAVTAAELAAIRDKFASVAPELSSALEELAGVFGVGDNAGGLSGLAAGIQGMTEEQANILEAYWNSVRMYTANIDSNVARIADILGADGVNTNPQLQQLQLIEQNTKSIQQLLQSTVKSGHSQGGNGLKVFVS